MLKTGLLSAGAIVTVVLFGQPSHGSGMLFGDDSGAVAFQPAARPSGGLLAGLMAVINDVTAPPQSVSVPVIPAARRADHLVLVRCGAGPRLCLIDLEDDRLRRD